MIALLGALVLTAAALGLNAWLLQFDAAADLVTPEPVRVVQSFVGTVVARRPASAATHLATSSRESVSPGRLRTIAADLHARHGVVRFEDGDTRRDGDSAEVRARLATTRDGIIERSFRLVRDHSSRLWKIADFDLAD